MSTKTVYTDNGIYHGHGSGIVGGFSICGDNNGKVTDDDPKVNCEKCLKVMTIYSKKRRWKLTPNMVELIAKHPEWF